MDDLRSAIMTRLKHSVQLLASQATIQFQALPDFVCKADELALDFDHWRSVAITNYEHEFTPSQLDALDALDCKFSDLTTGPKQQWTEEAVSQSHEWSEVRTLAVRILDAFHWPLEIPPGYQHEYVRARDSR